MMTPPPRRIAVWMCATTTTIVGVSLMGLPAAKGFVPFIHPPSFSASCDAKMVENSMSVSSSYRSQEHRGGGRLQTSRLLEKQPSAEEKSSDGSASVRFSGAEGLTSTTTNPVDAFLTVLASDVASIALGLIGLVVVVAHRVSLLDETSVDAMGVQTRTDLLAVFACGSVLLNGITKLDITAAMAETVILAGTALSKPELCTDEIVEEEDAATMLWALESLLTATPAMTAIVLERDSSSAVGTSSWRVLARGGTVPMDNKLVPDSTPILDRVSSLGNTKETYLPTLQALPGKKELPYLPSNAQLALLVPVIASEGGGAATETTRVLVLGSNRAKSFSPRDVAWSRIVAERMATMDTQ